MKTIMQVISLFALLLFFNCSPHEKKVNSNTAVLKLAAQIALPNVSGRIDHISYDAVHHLAFVAALGNNTIEVVNPEKKQVAHTITGLHEPQGIVYIPTLKRLAVANGDNGTCLFFDATNYSLLSSIDLKDDADNIRYDAETNLIYVGYGSGGIAIIDANTMKETGSIKLDGHPESFQIAKEQNRVYINVPGANEIEVADLTTHSIIARWKNTVASSNFPMALDENNNRLFIGYRNPSSLRMINTVTGKDLTTVQISGDADDIFYSAHDSLVFVSSGKGYIDIFQTNKNKLKQVSHVETRRGARTSLLLRLENKFLLAVPAGNGAAAALWIYDINSKETL